MLPFNHKEIILGPMIWDVATPNHNIGSLNCYNFLNFFSWSPASQMVLVSWETCLRTTSRIRVWLPLRSLVMRLSMIQRFMWARFLKCTGSTMLLSSRHSIMIPDLWLLWTKHVVSGQNNSIQPTYTVPYKKRDIYTMRLENSINQILISTWTKKLNHDM